MIQEFWHLDEESARELADQYLTSQGVAYRRFFSVTRYEDFRDSVFGCGDNLILAGVRVWEFGVSFTESEDDDWLVCGGTGLVFVDDLSQECGVFYRI